MVLILLRHGQTSHNADSLLQGQVDLPLDDVGIVQAKRAGAYISSRWDVHTIITSPLVRTHQTIEHAGFDPGLVTVDDRWREIDFGDLEGRPVRDAITELTEKWSADPEYRPSGGESIQALHDRVTAACAEVTRMASTQNVLVVTHATPIKSAAVWALDGPVSMVLKMWVGLGSISVFDEARGEVRLRELNTLLDAE